MTLSIKDGHCDGTVDMVWETYYFDLFDLTDEKDKVCCINIATSEVAILKKCLMDSIEVICHPDHGSGDRGWIRFIIGIMNEEENLGVRIFSWKYEYSRVQIYVDWEELGNNPIRYFCVYRMLDKLWEGDRLVNMRSVIENQYGCSSNRLLIG
uniref:Uncharacterized protein n=1 Tax=Marseillevirus LCMAC201 TaxID=2506605 RepID=A0A481YWN9_9VIRU|nr:MAG: hypothetical protein LCMAC201_03400 [Marseillevirus LCMAC201]